MIITVSPADLQEMDNKQDSIAYYQMMHIMTQDANGFYFTIPAKRKIIVLNPGYPKIQFTDVPMSAIKDECKKEFKRRYGYEPELMICLEGENV